jgi:DMSO/TMAO reductase YedYZ molybdopterin-dependent catalytic subunit
MTDIAAAGQGITDVELALATRNRGMPLEALRYDITPVGLHYLLAHFDIPALEPASWRLRVGGNVRSPLELTLEEIRSRPATTIPVTMECAGNGRARLKPRPISNPWLHEAVGTASWTGTPLAGVLQEAGIEPGTVEIVFKGADHGMQDEQEHDYARSLPVRDATRAEVLLAYEMNGRPLEPQHGFPLRLLVPGWYGMTSVKWLTSIEAVTEPFHGYQQAVAYHYRRSNEDPGEPVRHIRLRALMIPPGFPDFPDRRRYLDRGPVTIRGRAWSGAAPVASVEFGVDGGWSQAKLSEPIGEWAWRAWSHEWEAMPGQHVLACRATDRDGNSQPVDQPWNVLGMGNNVIQEVRVTVR